MKACPTPVLLGADLNCYSMARAFFEAYGTRSYAFGREVLGATRASKYIRFTAVPLLDDPRVARDTLRAFREAHGEEGPFLLLPSTDDYAHFLIEEGASLGRDFLLSVPPRDFLPYFEKTAFCNVCRARGIPYPTTESLKSPPTLEEAHALGARLGYPFVIKPSCSRTYWQHPFPGMEKVYFAYNAHAARAIFEKIYAAGYSGRLLAQQYIGGGDTAATVLTLYLDRESRTVLRAAGRVLLEEHTPCGKGNYAALLSAPIPPIAEALAAFLEEGGYRGFANFDLRRDPLTGKTYVLEMNLRQGRSAHFLTAGGENPATYLVRDVFLGERIPPATLQRDVLFRTVPRAVVRRYTKDPVLLARAEALFGTEGDENPYFHNHDLAENPKRLFYVLLHMWRERRKFHRALSSTT